LVWSVMRAGAALISDDSKALVGIEPYKGDIWSNG
jgi:hypothetical protein